MSRWRNQLFVGVAFLGVCALLVSRFLPNLGKDLMGVLGVAGALGGLVPVVEKIWRMLRPAEPRPSDVLADSLAKAVHKQWQQAAIERVLMMPAPIPVRWSLSDLAVAGSVAAAVGDPGVASVFFPSLPGQTRVTEEHLRAGGGRGELFAVYAGISSGRVVVVGAPGAGKTGTAILLLLDALAHRDRVNDKDRARIPVPVLFPAHGWDPATCSVQDWLAAQLATDYPLLQHRGGRAEADAFVADGVVALILDGLDEMDETRRPAALQALSDAPFRVVVLTRSQELVQAAADGGGWRGAVTLNPHPGRPSPRYSLTQAKQTLTFLAQQMNQDHTRDLAWWQIPRWTPAIPRVLTSMLAGGLLGAFLGGLMSALGHAAGFGPDHGLWGLRILQPGLAFGLGAGLPLGLGFGRGGAEPQRVRSWRAISVWSVLRVGLVYGFVLVFATGFGALAGAGLMLAHVIPDSDDVFMFVPGLTVGLLLGLKRMLRGQVGKGEGSSRGTLKSKRNDRLFRVFRHPLGLKRHLFLLDLKRDLVGGLRAGEGSPQGPRESKRNDQVFGLMAGLTLGLAFGLASGLIGFTDGLTAGLMGLAFWLMLGIPVALMYGIMSSVTWSTTLAWCQLQRSRHVPAVRLMPFLEDARDRGALRTVGAVYQFRHAILQDQLARTDHHESRHIPGSPAPVVDMRGVMRPNASR